MPSIKLSPGLKALIASPRARGSVLAAPSSSKLDQLFTYLRSSANEHGVGSDAWLTISSATLVTLNSPDSLKHLYSFATKDIPEDEQVRTAALMREVGLKCISFNGIPRSINNLAALRSAMPPSVQTRLGTTPTREPTSSSSILSSAHSLWNSIYDPHSTKLISILRASHPDLPVHILNSHYGPLLSDPSSSSQTALGESTGTVGRILTSIIAIACLRAQGGVEPQVVSHVLGLRKASLEEQSIEVLEAGQWLTSEQGAKWVVECVDRIVEQVNEGNGPTFASGQQQREFGKAKL